MLLNKYFFQEKSTLFKLVGSVVFQHFCKALKFLPHWNKWTNILDKYLKGFETKPNVLDQIKLRSSFWLKINFRKLASNKHVDLRKKENFVRSKGKTAPFRKSCNNWNRWWDSSIQSEKMGDIWQWLRKFKPQYHSILPLIQYSFKIFDLQRK